MHSYTSAVSQFLSIFRCHWKPSWQTHWSIPISSFRKHWGMVQWWQWLNHALGNLRQCTHKKLWGLIPELSSTSHFTLISAEGPLPEWEGPVVSVCQNRWTLDPLSAFPAKKINKKNPCLFLSQSSFRLDLFQHHRSSTHFLSALPLRCKQIKTVFIGIDSYVELGYFYFCFFSFSLTQPSQSKGNHSRGKIKTPLYPLLSIPWTRLLVFQCDQNFPSCPPQLQTRKG